MPAKAQVLNFAELHYLLLPLPSFCKLETFGSAKQIQLSLVNRKHLSRIFTTNKNYLTNGFFQPCHSTF